MNKKVMQPKRPTRQISPKTAAKKKEARKVAGEAFNICAMLLGNKQCIQWEVWVKKMTNSDPWVSL